MSGYSIRNATGADLPRIVEIYNASIPGRLATGDMQPVSVASRQAWFDAHSVEKYPLIVSERGNVIAGWGSLSAFHARASYRFTAEISVYIAPEHARKGVGAELTDELLRRCPELKIKSVVALIFGHNDPSLRLFRKKGFVTWGKLPCVADLDGIERDLDILGLRMVK